MRTVRCPPITCSSPATLLRRRLRHGLGLRRGLLDRAHVHEGALGQVVPLALAELPKRADRLLERRVVAGLDGEPLGHEDRMREEALDYAYQPVSVLVGIVDIVTESDSTGHY